MPMVAPAFSKQYSTHDRVSEKSGSKSPIWKFFVLHPRVRGDKRNGELWSC
jgi:hypothetical protein